MVAMPAIVLTIDENVQSMTTTVCRPLCFLTPYCLAGHGWLCNPVDLRSNLTLTEQNIHVREAVHSALTREKRKTNKKLQKSTFSLGHHGPEATQILERVHHLCLHIYDLARPEVK